MDLRNKTTWSAGFFNCAVAVDTLMASVVARRTYRWNNGTLEPETKNPLPVTNEPIDLGSGKLDGETPFLRGGVDFIVTGKAYAPAGKPTRWFVVEFKAGKTFRRRLLVMGNRVWAKRLLAIEPTEAEEFVSMPLGHDRAYGGVSLCEAGEMAFSANPEGGGFYLDKDQAVGNPLPNLEDPDRLIQKWSDQPRPLAPAPYPKTWALRMLNAMECDLEATPPRIKRIKPELYNNAHPSFIVDGPLNKGDPVEVSHLTPGGPLRFLLPDLAMHAHVQLEQRHFAFPLALESIGILGEERRVFLTSRVAFKYRIIPHERRVATLYDGPCPTTVPGAYVVDFDKENRLP